ncbi:hypothetical protein BSZ35_13885 [Salinibacter sp. 10B]|uniref:hypothetical protein n=1 Tax=Salinibacter sp. 10B TaxID=1923971 RepID=UPI000CF3CE2D|nr:hypothetical protein [Salinibacter sp. 10B]PQJ35548.1 hypothetical protein BSZ35_13885 [Salinibacter sp. 10B]
MSTFHSQRTEAHLLALLMLSATLFLGCQMPFGAGSDDGDDVPSFEARDQIEIEPGLIAKLYAPDRVAAGDSFHVRFIAKNTTEGSIQMKTGACWGQPIAIFDGEQIPLIGSYQICTMQLLSWTLPGQETRERTFDLKASMNTSRGSFQTTEHAEPGTYTLQTTVDWTIGGQKVEKSLEADVEIFDQE